MKEIISGLSKLLDSRVRLGIMSALAVNDNMDFGRLKEVLDVTDGNLASHLRALEKENLVEVRKQFVGRKPNTSYSITAAGMELFREHIDALERIIHSLPEK
jgi:DNA-binding MarR family transcriptional regulator